MRWPFTRRKVDAELEPVKERKGLWSTDTIRLYPDQPKQFDFQLPQHAASMAMDNSLQGGGVTSLYSPGIPEALLEWYASQSFIGYSACALIAQHWLVDKCCRMPARDAIRQGYMIDVGDDDLAKQIRKSDVRYGVNRNMTELIAFGRVYGIRCVVFDVLSVDPDYYQKPFNIDGVLPGCYRGMRQVDPNWMTAELTASNLCDPADPKFFEPEFYRVGAKRYHRSHLHFFVPHPVPDLLKPAYKYGGVSVPQRIYERVYASERTANEAPQLAMTKRLTTFQASPQADLREVLGNMAQFAEIRNNYGVLVTGSEETVGQFDTALADFDALVMTQYQLVASAANVPATKLLGTTPKGFNATGEYEEATYREELESIQANDLTPLLERHYRIQCKSQRIDLPDDFSVQWQPLDSPTATEWAALNKTKADTDKVYYDMGAIDGDDVLNRLRNDREGDYFGIPANAPAEGGETDPLEGYTDPIEPEAASEANPDNPAPT